MWTKVIRNQTAVQYLFDVESHNPHHQFQHQLLQPVKVYAVEKIVNIYW